MIAIILEAILLLASIVGYFITLIYNQDLLCLGFLLISIFMLATVTQNIVNYRNNKIKIKKIK